MPRVPGDFVLRLLAGRKPEPRGQRLREAFEELGAIFVKFGQVLSTRRDLLPLDIADELAKLQDQVPPFDPQLAFAEIERSLGRRVEEVLASLERVPVASASIAQVHLGRLKDDREVAVKVLRPAVEAEIAKDLALLQTAASLVERLSPEGRRLKPREVVAEFARHLDEELNLLTEAANASQLRRNFRNSVQLAIPEVHWDLCSERVMVMQRMHGVPISHIAELRDKGIDLKALARAGVEICFTQVFRDGFFHADMHPGTILVATDRELRTTAKPFLERWMSEQIGGRGVLRTLRQEAPYWANTLPQLPRLLHRALAEDRLGALGLSIERLTAENARRNDLLVALLVVLVAALILLGIGLF